MKTMRRREVKEGVQCSTAGSGQGPGHWAPSCFASSWECWWTCGLSMSVMYFCGISVSQAGTNLLTSPISETDWLDLDFGTTCRETSPFQMVFQRVGGFSSESFMCFPLLIHPSRKALQLWASRARPAQPMLLQMLLPRHRAEVLQGFCSERDHLRGGCLLYEGLFWISFKLVKYLDILFKLS